MDDRYNGGLIGMDHASGRIFLHNQISLGVGDTLQGKLQFERIAKENGVRIKAYHADNHPFAAKNFLADLELKDQTISF